MNIRISKYIFLLYLAQIDFGFGYEYILEGNVKYQLFLQQGQVIAEQESSFVFREKDCNWLVKCVPHRFVKFGKEQPLYAYELASSDGTNFYELESLSGLPKPAKPFEGVIGPGSDPFGLSDPRLTTLWYAFGSSCYFAKRNGNLVNPPTANTGSQTYAKDFHVPAIWQIESNPPFLPEAIFFYKTNESTLTTFTNVIYKVHEFKSVAGLLLPKAISMQYFFTQSLSNKPTTWITADMEIEVTNFQATSPNEDFTVKIPGGRFCQTSGRFLLQHPSAYLKLVSVGLIYQVRN
jgi:hypothetical protein